MFIRVSGLASLSKISLSAGITWSVFVGSNKTCNKTVWLLEIPCLLSIGLLTSKSDPSMFYYTENEIATEDNKV